jgi:hypothetical protein
MAEVAPVLPQGAGYGVVAGIGFFFALLISFISYIQVRANYFDYLFFGLSLWLTPSGTDTPNTRPKQVRSSILPAEVSNLD